MNTTPLTTAELEGLSERLTEWSRVTVDGVTRIERTFAIPDYVTAMTFTQLLGEMADVANHHPTVLVQREHVTVAWWTMTTRSLSRIDITMAERTDRLFTTLADGNAAASPNGEAAGGSSPALSGGAVVKRDTSRTPSARAAEER